MRLDFALHYLIVNTPLFFDMIGMLTEEIFMILLPVYVEVASWQAQGW